MTDNAITLYSYEFSPYAAKVRCFLGLKELDYQTHYVNPLRARAELPVGHQVPVLKIGGEARNDSTPIGLWLDERFPERPPLLPEAGPERERLLEMDREIARRFIPLSFRLLIAFGEPLGVRFRNRGLGARAVDRTTPGGYPLRWLHPFMVSRIGFIRRQIEATDLNRPNGALLDDAAADIVAWLEGAAFMGGRDRPSLPDLSAFAVLSLPYLAGYAGADGIERHPALMDWFARVRAYLPPDAVVRADLAERRWP